MKKIDDFLNKIGLKITSAIATMWCALVFVLIALISLPGALATRSSIVIVSWVAQTFLQLVLLSIIMVGQRLQGEASEARTAKIMKHMSKELDDLYKRICK